MKENRLESMAKELYSMRYGDCNDLESHRICSLLEEYTKLLVPDLFNVFDKVWKQREKKQFYGDCTWTMEKFDEKKVEDDGEVRIETSVRVVFINLNLTANNTSFLVIREDNDFSSKIHVRIVYKKGEYKGVWPGHKSLSWYKKHKFSPKYGDSRDSGYVVTAEKFRSRSKVEYVSPSGFQTLTKYILPYFEKSAIDLMDMQ